MRLLLLWTMAAMGLAAEPIRVCATLPDLAGLMREIGGDAVAVDAFAAGGEDPHQVKARPGFVRQLADARLLVHAGMDLEIGWLPLLVANARNRAVQPGAPGDLDASAAIDPLGVPAGVIDRSHGDVHAAGNPHYLADPLNGLAVAALIRQRLSVIDPHRAGLFASREADFRRRVGIALVGAELAAKYDAAKLAALHAEGVLGDFLRTQHDDARLGGWIGLLAAHAGRAVVADHDLWPYLARRFRFTVAGFLEPRPGVPPTTRHLAKLMALMRDRSVRVILTVPYADPRHARLVAQRTGAVIATMAHQMDVQAGADGYLRCIDGNVRRLADAFAATKP